MSLLETDWQAERPSAEQAQASLQRLRFDPWPLLEEPWQDLLWCIRQNYAIGGAVFGRFRFPVDPTLHWFGSRNRWEELGFLTHFLLHPVTASGFPELRLGEASDPELRLEWGSTFLLEGELAAILWEGGAYGRRASEPGDVRDPLPASPAEAKDLAVRACHTLLGARFDEVLVYKAHKPWTPWFGDVCWDHTWLGIDKRDAAVWLLCATDVD